MNGKKKAKKQTVGEVDTRSGGIDRLKNEQRHADQLDFLLVPAMELAELPPEEDIYDFITGQFQEAIKKQEVIV